MLPQVRAAAFPVYVLSSCFSSWWGFLKDICSSLLCMSFVGGWFFAPHLRRLLSCIDSSVVRGRLFLLPLCPNFGDYLILFHHTMLCRLQATRRFFTCWSPFFRVSQLGESARKLYKFIYNFPQEEPLLYFTEIVWACSVLHIIAL